MNRPTRPSLRPTPVDSSEAAISSPRSQPGAGTNRAIAFLVLGVVAFFGAQFSIHAETLDDVRRRALDPAPTRNVGMIPADLALDDPAFTVCDESRVFEAYQVTTVNERSRRQLATEILESLPAVPGAPDGWITLRFVINCQGETGRFRVLAVDRSFRPIEPPAPLVRELLRRSALVRGWKPGIRDGRPADSLNHFVFKIRDGRAVELLP